VDTVPALEARSIVKRFPGVVALKGVSFDLRPGEVHALVGENGAGKSTLIKVLSGIHPHGSFEGELLVGGNASSFRSVADAERSGIAVIYQELALVGGMTVAENVFLGREPVSGLTVDWIKMDEDTRALLRRFNVELNPETPIQKLGVGHKQLVEIVKALSKNSRILILDEPTAALSGPEVKVLLNMLRDLRQHGISIIYISHKLEEVFAIADRITVLRDGESIATHEAKATDTRQIIREMVGREIADLYPKHASSPGEALLEVSDLNVAEPESGRTILREISFAAHAGEVLGIGGLMGAGRSELLMHLFGAWGRRLSGSVLLEGWPLANVSPDETIRHGMVLVTEDRKRYGLVLDHSIAFNLSLSSLDALTSGGLIDRDAELRRNQEFVSALRIKAASLDAAAGGLSGGNQQKVVIGKALMTRPKVVLLDEPTRGIDVGAKLEVYELIGRLCAEGRAIVMVSSELPELMGICDRIVMLGKGRIGGTFKRDEATAEQLMASAM
jgi:D-xylose transport system ATP-binding protein